MLGSLCFVLCGGQLDYGSQRCVRSCIFHWLRNEISGFQDLYLYGPCLCKLKLQDFLQCGYLSREHIFYKLIKNAVDFVTAVNNDFSKETK